MPSEALVVRSKSEELSAKDGEGVGGDASVSQLPTVSDAPLIRVRRSSSEGGKGELKGVLVSEGAGGVGIADLGNNRLASFPDFPVTNLTPIIRTTKYSKYLYLWGIKVATVETEEEPKPEPKPEPVSSPSFGGGQGEAAIVIHLADHLGGSNIDTSLNGDILQIVDYLPFGSERIVLNPEVKSSASDWSSSVTKNTYRNKYRFIGKERDVESDLLYVEARYYDSDLGRFISQDPASRDNPQNFASVPQQFNFYSYSANNPITHSGPTWMCVDGVTTVVCVVAWMALSTMVAGYLSIIYVAITRDPSQPVSDTDRLVVEWGFTLIEAGGSVGMAFADKAAPFDNRYELLPLTEFKETKIESELWICDANALNRNNEVKLESLVIWWWNGVIKITDKGFQHTIERHTIWGQFNDNKSMFNGSENVIDLIKQSEGVTPVLQYNWNYKRTVDAWRNIWTDRNNNGAQTNIYTVITDKDENLVTAFPGS